MFNTIILGIGIAIYLRGDGIDEVDENAPGGDGDWPESESLQDRPLLVVPSMRRCILV